MSAPDPDLLGDIDGFNIASLWIGAGVDLSTPLVAYYLDGPEPGGYRQRFRTFVANQFGDPDDPSSWRGNAASRQQRINRFDDLFAAGPAGSLLAMTPPPPRSWAFTSDALDTFFGWLEEAVNMERSRFDG
jgi:hypothetical protein